RSPHLRIGRLEHEVLARRRLEDLRMAALEPLPCLGHELREMHVLAVGAERHEHRKFSGGIRTEHVAAERRAVARGDGDILVEDHGAGSAATSTKAITQGSSVRLLQAWLVPR